MYKADAERCSVGSCNHIIGETCPKNVYLTKDSGWHVILPSVENVLVRNVVYRTL